MRYRCNRCTVSPGPEFALIRVVTSTWQRTLAAIALIGGLLGLRYVNGGLRPADTGGMFREQRSLMGTLWSIEVPDHGRSPECARAVAAAYRELDRIDALMSEWKPESPISQVDAAAGLHPVEVPAELRELIERSIGFSRKTEGTFDITWRGMGNIWRFDDGFRVPSAAAVAKARKNINYRAIQIEGNRIFLPAGMSIGLGGIAKGYAVDRAAHVLAGAGFTDSLVDGGGDLLASGTKYGAPWRLGVQDPRGEHGKLLGVVSISNAALVSSGDYERFRIVDGVRYHHIIDPRTGWPANASIGVTVLTKSAEQGVVLGKGIFILGAERGLALARAEGVEALVVDAGQQQYQTDGFRRAFARE